MSKEGRGERLLFLNFGAEQHWNMNEKQREMSTAAAANDGGERGSNIEFLNDQQAADSDFFSLSLSLILTEQRERESTN